MSSIEPVTSKIPAVTFVFPVCFAFPFNSKVPVVDFDNATLPSIFVPDVNSPDFKFIAVVAVILD